MKEQCLAPDCVEMARSRGLCERHRSKWRKGTYTGPVREPWTGIYPEPGLKRCSRCRMALPLDYFDRQSGGKRHGACKDCRSEYMRKRLLRYRYGITHLDYDQMLALQDGGCAACGKPPERNRLHVDHDHSCCDVGSQSCGQCVRGLLCTRCNTALAVLEDEHLVEGLQRYLRNVVDKSEQSGTLSA